MSASGWWEPSAIVAVCSLLIAALGLLISYSVSRRSFSQSTGFKAIDLAREEIANIRSACAEFLSSHTERFLIGEDLKNISKTLQTSFDPDTTASSEKPVLISQAIELRNIHHKAFSNQLIAYQKIRLLIGNDNGSTQLYAAMDDLIDGGSPKDGGIKPFTDAILRIIDERQVAVKAMMKSNK